MPKDTRIIIIRGKSRIAFSSTDGELLEKKEAPGEEGAFDFLKAYLMILPSSTPPPYMTGPLGPATKGAQLFMNNKLVKLPDDAYVDKLVPSPGCSGIQPCPPWNPIIGVTRGKSRIEFTLNDGALLKEEISVGEEGIFDFLQPYLKVKNP